MNKLVGLVLAAAIALAPLGAEARGRHHNRHHPGGGHLGWSHIHHYSYKIPVVHTTRATGHHHSNPYCATCARDTYGRIARSAKAEDEFKMAHPCPATGKTSGACPGYVIDHVQALKHGGGDAPSNMQWQTKTDAKAKDKRE